MSEKNSRTRSDVEAHALRTAAPLQTSDRSPGPATPGVRDPANPPGRKLPGWQKRLTDYLRDNHARPFAPGRWDCAIWAAGAVAAMTGEDHLRGLRGYRSIAEGKRRLQARGFADHVAYVASLLPEVPPAFAQPGDVAVIGDQSLGIVQGAQVYIFGMNGFGMAPFPRIERAFRV